MSGVIVGFINDYAECEGGDLNPYESYPTGT
jgi:hypothetical protein